MSPATIEVHFPLDRIMREGFADDDFLINCMGKVNDTPGEDGMPLRAWVVKTVHETLKKKPKLREVLVKPTTVKNSPTQFRVIIDE